MLTATYEYAIIRVVPRVEREEFLNVGVVLSSMERRFLKSRIEPDWDRLLALAPSIDRALVAQYLALFPRICAGGDDAGPIGRLPHRARFHWLVAPRSTIIQTSAVHSGIGHDLDRALDDIFEDMVSVSSLV